MVRALKMLAVALVAVLVLAAGAYLALLLRTRALEERLVRDANAIFGTPRSRPTHVDTPEPGTLGEALSKHLSAFRPVWRAVADDAAAMAAQDAVLFGKLGPADLPRACVDAIEGLKEDLDGVLRGARVANADLEVAGDPYDASPAGNWLAYQMVAFLAGARARQALAAGNASAALSDCLDGLGLGRDAAVSGGLIGHMIGLKCIEKLAPTCVDAMASASEADRTDSIDRLRKIRDAVPGFEKTMREEAVAVQVTALGPMLGAEFSKRLLGRARLMANGWGVPSMDERGLLRTWFERLVWRDRQEIYDELVTDSAMRGAARNAAFATLAEKVSQRGSWIRSELPQPLDYRHYAQRAEIGIARLDLVVLAGAAASFRGAHGRWPRDIGELAASGLVTALERERNGEVRLVPSAGDALEIVTPIEKPAEDAPSEARVVVSGP
ncbi:MAG: hypothetical protein QM765_00190 [Myxococcales bacterium]